MDGEKQALSDTEWKYKLVPPFQKAGGNIYETTKHAYPLTWQAYVKDFILQIYLHKCTGKEMYEGVQCSAGSTREKLHRLK